MDDIQFEMKNVYTPDGFHGSGEIFLGMKNVVPVIHGTAGCSCYVWGNVNRSDCVSRYINTSTINDQSISSGQSFKKLNDAIQWVEKKYRPDLIPIISTPISDILGDDLAQSETLNEKKEIFYVKTDSLRDQEDNSKEKVLEQLVIRFATKNQKVKKTVNILGPSFNTFNWQSDLNELIELLEKLNVTVNTVFPMDASIRDIEKITTAELNLVMYSYALPAAKHLYSSFGMDFLNCYTVGFKNTIDLILKIGEKLDIQVSDVIHREMERQYTPFENLLKSPWHDHLVNELRNVAIVGNTTQAVEIADFISNEVGMKPILIATVDDIDKQRFYDLLNQKSLEPEVVITKAKSHIVEQQIKKLIPNVILGTDYEEKIAEQLGVSAFIPICHPTMVTYALGVSSYWGFRGGCFLTQEMLRGGVKLLKRIRSINVSSGNGSSREDENFIFTLQWTPEAQEKFNQIYGLIPKFLGNRIQIAQRFISMCEKFAQKEGKVTLMNVESAYSKFESRISK